MSRRPPVRGFTLIELLVALAVMAMMAALSWRGLDGMMRVHGQTQERTDAVLALEAGLGQWAADLDAIVQLPQAASMDWDGRVLRLTRRSSAWPGEGLLVVAWSRRTVGAEGTWLRWQSPPLRTRGELEQAWLKAAQWAQNPGDEERRREVAVVPLAGWQIFYFRSDAWSNPLSSGDGSAEATVTAAQVAPDGIRLVLTLPAEHPLAGVIQHDWIRPGVGGGKS